MKRLLFLAAVSLLGAAPQSAVPLRRHPSNPHYFEFRGRPTVLVTSGEHYGAVLNMDFDYIPYLNELQSRGFNQTRTFSGIYVESWGAPWNTLNPNSNRTLAPWARSGTPGYVDGGNKFDFNRWDDAYFARLRDFVAQAGQRGIVVELVLFCVMYSENEWVLSPFHGNANVNGLGVGIPRDQVFTQFNGAIQSAQEALTSKIVRELNGYDNVYYELINEPYASNVTLAWHQRIADVIVQTEAGLPNKHLIAHNINNGSGVVSNPINSVGVLNYHYASPPDAVAQNFHLGRVIAFDETGFRGGGDDPYRKEAWEFLLAGGGVYSNLDWSYTESSETGNATNWDHNLGPGGPGIRGQLSILKRFMDGFDLPPMAPNNAVIAGGVPAGAGARALVQPGEQYAVFVNGGSQANLVLNLPAGAYRAEWVNTRSGAVDRAEDLSHPGGNRTISSPGYSQDIALRVKKTGAAPPTGSASFYRAINLNGPALSIDGNAWEGANAPNVSYSGSAFENQSIPLSPPTDAARASMIRSSIWNRDGSNVAMSNVPAGRYQVYLYVWEDNFSQTYSISMEGQVVQGNYASGGGGHWDKLGPWTMDVADGTINVACTAGDANLSGLEVWRISSGPTTPPPPPPPPPPGGQTFYRGINLNGPALSIDGNAWEGSGAANYGYTGSAFENPSVPLSPATDAARASMIRSSIWNRAGSNVTMTSVPAGRYAVSLYVWEDNFSQTYDVSLNGQVVRSGYASGSGGHWDKLGPWTVDVADGSIRVNCSAADANLSGLEVWRVSGTTPPPPPSGLVAHWALDGSTGDASGNGNHGILSPDGPVWTTGRGGGALDFNGEGDTMSAPSSPSLNSLKTRMTLAMWIYKRTDAPTWGVFAGRRRGALWEDLWVLFCNNSASDEYHFALTTSSGTVTLTGPSSVGDRGVWTHLAGVYDGSNLILYRNGQEVARRAQTGTIADESSPVVIGGGDNGTEGMGEYVNAALDDVRLYNRALTAAELQALAAP